MIRTRYELKYLVSPPQAAALADYIRPYMCLDRHSPDGEYQLVSLYLDSADLRLCRESLDGLKNRYKLRIRSYSDAPTAPCFFEIKRRIDRVVVKSRCCLPRTLVPALLREDRTHAACAAQMEGPNLEQFLYYQRQLAAAPVIRVRYTRLAFEGRFDPDVRMTFDRNLAFNVTRTCRLEGAGTGWQRLPEQAVVCEVKFSAGYPVWIGRMIEQFGLRQQSVSKYARAVTHACHLRFCAPRARREVTHAAALELL